MLFNLKLQNLLEKYSGIFQFIGSKISHIFVYCFLVFLYPFITIKVLVALSELNPNGVMLLISYIYISQKLPFLFGKITIDKQKTEPGENINLLVLGFSSLCLIFVLINQTPIDVTLCGSISFCMESEAQAAAARELAMRKAMALTGCAFSFVVMRNMSTASLNALGKVGISTADYLWPSLMIGTSAVLTGTATGVAVPAVVPATAAAVLVAAGRGRLSSVADHVLPAIRREFMITPEMARDVGFIPNSVAPSFNVVSSGAAAALPPLSGAAAAVPPLSGNAARARAVSDSVGEFRASLCDAGQNQVAFFGGGTFGKLVEVAPVDLWCAIMHRAYGRALEVADITRDEFMALHLERAAAIRREDVYTTLVEPATRELESYVREGKVLTGHSVAITLPDGGLKRLFMSENMVHVFILNDSEIKDGFQPVETINHRFQGEEVFREIIVNGQLCSFPNLLDACFVLKKIFGNDPKRIMLLIGQLLDDAQFRREGSKMTLRFDTVTLLGDPHTIADVVGQDAVFTNDFVAFSLPGHLLDRKLAEYRLLPPQQQRSLDADAAQLLTDVARRRPLLDPSSQLASSSETSVVQRPPSQDGGMTMTQDLTVGDALLTFFFGKGE